MNRGITAPDQADLSLVGLLPFHSLKNISDATHRLYLALTEQQKILIVGDFDADGATSTTIAVRILRDFGAQHVNFLLPDRFKFGYGLTPGIVDVALENKPDLIITVDNGISSLDGVAHAQQHGVDVLITDHHLPGEAVPDAITVNPNQREDDFPSKNLAGVGVIFYVMCALRSFLREKNYFSQQQITEPSMSQYLDIVALGTVADVVPLDRNNRILVRQGLNRMRSGHACHGIEALCQVSGRNIRKLSATDLGFALGPRINAAGRLDDMSIGVRCLLSERYDEALQYASQLHELNAERRGIEAQMQLDAIQFIEASPIPEQYSMGVCLFGEDWHQGIVGLIASRIKEKIYRPVVAFAPHVDGLMKGSGRSIPGLHLRDVLADIAAQHPLLIDKFGGHAMAVGLTLKQENYALFQSAFNQAVTHRLDKKDCEPVIYSDGQLSYTELSLKAAYEIKQAGPWGQAFPRPTFDGLFTIIEQRVVGDRHLKLRLMPHGVETKQWLDAIAFGIADHKEWPNYHCDCVRVAYELDINEYRGRESLQLMVQYMEPA